jgi:hypothetical protein
LLISKLPRFFARQKEQRAQNDIAIPFFSIPSEPAYVKSPVHVDDLAGGKG